MPLSPYEETLLQGQDENPYRDTLQLQQKHSETALRVAAKVVSSNTPDRQAEILKLADRTGLPTSVIERNYDAIRQRSQVVDTDYAKMLRDTPKTAEYFSNPENAAVSQDDHEQLGLIESILDIGRSLVAAVPQFIGSTTAGTGDLLDIATRKLLRTKDQGPISIALQEAGQAWKDIGRLWVAPPPERQTLATDISGSLGQLAGQIAETILAPELVLPSFMAQGADTMHEHASELGKEGSAGAELAGAAVMGLFGKYGLDKLMERIPAPIQNAILRRIVDVTIAGGYQAGLQVVQSTANNVITRMALDPNQPIVHDLTREAIIGGATGTVARGLLGIALPSLASQLQKREAARQNEAFFKALGEGVQNSKTFERLSDKGKEFVAAVTKDGPIERIYVPVEPFTEYYAGKGIDPRTKATEVMGDSVAYDRAVLTGEDLAVPTGDYAAKIATDPEAHAFLSPELRLTADAMNAREAGEFEKAREEAARQPSEAVPQDVRTAAEADIETRQAIVSPELQLVSLATVTPEGAPAIDFLDRIEQAAWQRIRERGTLTGTRLGAGLPIEDIADVVIIGAAKIAKGIRNFAEWSRQMIEEHGDRIRPYLYDLYTRSAQSAVQQFGTPLKEATEGFSSIAAEHAVTQVEAEAAVLRPLFTTQEQSGKTDAEWAAYRSTVQQSHDSAVATVTEGIEAELKRQRSEWWAGERDAIRTQTTAEFHQERVYQALSRLRFNKLPDGTELPLENTLKLDLGWVNERYGKSSKKPGEVNPLTNFLVNKGIARKEGGLNPDLVAEQFGYASGDEMIRALASAADMEAAIEAKTEQRMFEKHGEPLTDQSIGTQAREAVFTIGRSEVIEAERRALQKKTREVTPFVNAALKDERGKGLATIRKGVPNEGAIQFGRLSMQTIRRLASEQIASTTVREARPLVYFEAARRAGKLALELVAKDDYAAALEAKTRELMNVELYRSALDAQKGLEKMRDQFGKFFRPDGQIARTRDMNYVEGARAIAASTLFPQREFTVNEALEKIQAYDPQAYEVIQDKVLSNLKPGQDYRDLSFQALRDLHEAAMGLWELAKREQAMNIDGRLIRKEEIKSALGQQLSEHSRRFGNTGVEGLPTQFEHAERWFLGAKAWGRRVESWVTAMDGGPDGPFRQFIWNPVKEAVNRYRVRKVEYLTKYRGLLEPIQHTLTAAKIDAPELNYTFGRDGSGGRAELLGALLHSGNRNDQRSNLAKLLVGRKWGSFREDGTLDTTRWDGFIDRMRREGVLTKGDYDFIQSIWDLFEELKPGLQKTHKDVYGFYFKEVPADGFTAFGESYRGGYVPAITDPLMSSAADIRNEKQMAFESDATLALPSAGKRSTISRVKAFEPLAMNLQFIPQHIDWALRFSEIQPAVKDVTRLITDKGLRAQLDAHDPEAAKDMLMPWLMRSATQRVNERGKWKGLDRFMTAVRSRTGLQVLSFNVGNALQQFTGGIVATVKIENKRYMAEAAYRYFRSPKESAEFIRGRSPFMQTFLTSQAFEIQQQIDNILLNPSSYAKASNYIREHSQVLASGTQNIVNHIAWMAAYEEATAQRLKSEDAVRHADNVVRETQGSFHPEDISRMEANTPFVRAMSMFASYFNMDANLLMTEVGNAVRSDRGTFARAGRIMSVLTLGFMLPSVISKSILNGLSGDWKDDNDGTHIDELLNLFVGANASTAFAMLPIAGQFASAAYGALFTDQSYDDDIRVSPTAGMIGSAIKDMAGHSSHKQEARDFLTVLGLILNKPLGPLGKPLGYFIDVAEGKADPEGAIDWARGMVSGVTPKK